MAKNKIDQINDAFIEILTKENAKGYKEYLKAINRELIDNVDDLTPEKVTSIINGIKPDISDMALLFMIQNAIILIVSKKVPKKEKENFAPIIALAGLYSLKKPKRFVEKVVKINKGIGLNDREKQAQALIQDFEEMNKKVLRDANKQSIKRLNKAIKKSKVSKRILRDFKRGLKEGKSIAKIKRSLVRKYNQLSNIDRALDTEIHAQSEYVRKEHSLAIGYTHKTWKTQEDSRVRETHFHNGVADKRIPIDSEFRAGGLRADIPGDQQLPPSDRIRCRCYLEYD